MNDSRDYNHTQTNRDEPSDAPSRNVYREFRAAVAECYAPLVHPDYAIELAAYNRGERPWPPCERCAGQIPDAPFTGALLCEDCRV